MLFTQTTSPTLYDLRKAFPGAGHLMPDQLRQSVELRGQALLVKSMLDSGAFQGPDRLLAATLVDRAKHRLGCSGIHCSAD
jgi:hypothetical protein